MTRIKPSAYATGLDGVWFIKSSHDYPSSSTRPPACPTLLWQESDEQLTSKTCVWMRSKVGAELLPLEVGAPSPPQPAKQRDQRDMRLSKAMDTAPVRSVSPDPPYVALVRPKIGKSIRSSPSSFK